MEYEKTRILKKELKDNEWIKTNLDCLHDYNLIFNEKQLNLHTIYRNVIKVRFDKENDVLYVTYLDDLEPPENTATIDLDLIKSIYIE